MLITIVRVESRVDKRLPIPHVPRVRHFAIAADNELEAELIACQWAASKPHVRMPTASAIVDVIV